MRDQGPPHLLTERGYWLCPVQVFGGMVWGVAGFGLGVLLTRCFS